MGITIVTLGECVCAKRDPGDTFAREARLSYAHFVFDVLLPFTHDRLEGGVKRSRDICVKNGTSQLYSRFFNIPGLGTLSADDTL